MTWVQNITLATYEVLDSKNNGLVLHVENMDTKRYSGKTYLNNLYSFYKEKYRDTAFDLILSSDNNAFNFLRKHGSSLFPDVPIVFSGVNNFKPSQIANHSLFTGVSEVFSDIDTIKIMLRLHPKTRKIFIINDYTLTGQAWSKTIRRNISEAGLKSKVEFEFAENTSLHRLKSYVEILDDNTLVLLGVYFKGSQGSYANYEDIGQQIAQSSNRPVYALLNFNITDNVVGGNVIGGYFQGQKAAQIGLKILSGIKPVDIPIVTKESNRNTFNWIQLERWGISPDLLPENSMVINKPPSFYSMNKLLIWSVITVIGLLVFGVVIQFWLNILQKRLNQRLEIKVAERTSELSRQGKMMEGISRLSHTGGWELDITTMSLKWTKETYLIHEVPDDYKPDLDKGIEFYTSESRPIISTAVKCALAEGISFDEELTMITAKGRHIIVRALGEIVYEMGIPKTLLGSFQDITKQKEVEESIRQMALTDSLTGLANRNQLQQRLEQSIKLAKREGAPLALMMIDLDRFKPVNDNFGHPTGDALLKVVASIFTKLTRETDLVARIGGDEFVIIVVHPDSIEGVEIIAQRIIDEIEKPISIIGNEIQISTSIGIALFPKDANNQEELFKKADLALYRVKESGRGSFNLYHPEENTQDVV